MFFSLAAANLANLLCQLIIVRKLTVTDYGDFNSLLSVFMIISLPINALNTMVVKFASAYNHLGERTRADRFLTVVSTHMFFTGILFFAAYLVSGFYFKNYLNLDSIWPVYLTGAMLFATILLTVPLGGIQGFEKFKWFGVSLVASGVFKLLLVFIFLSLGWGLLGALGGYLASQLIVLFISVFPLRKSLFLKDERLDIRLYEKYNFVIPSLITLGCIGVLTNMDVIFVKHYFGSVEAGCYSVAQVIGKIVFFMPGAIYLVMMPRASGLHALEEDPRGLLRHSLKYTVILCFFVIAAYNIFPQIIMGILTGKVNNEIISLGRIFSVTMAFFSLVNMLSLYQLSVSRFNFLKWLVLFTCLQVSAILIFHVTLAQVLSVMLINAAVLFIISFKSAMRK